MRKKLFLGLCALMLFNLSLIAQIRTIQGKVLDKAGKPIDGASVIVKGKNTGTSASADGTFKINAATGDVLVVSSVNYGSTEVKLRDQNTISITLSKVDNALEEVVVTALGQSKSKSKVGYTATTFNSGEINKNAPVGVLDGIAGKVAGADISNTGGPGSSTKVILRGYGNLGGANQPLYVIDGVPLSDGQFQNENGGLDFGNGMSNINPNDVESITVLKGTAATALYGSNAKNGAIMITTKRGKAGKLRVDYTGSYNISKVGKLPDYQDQFGTGWGGQYIPDENGSWGPALDGKMRPWGSIVDNSQLIKPFSFIKNNLRDFYNTGTELSNTIALSGGNENNRFYFSYGNVFSDGVIPTKTDYLERHTFALRTNSNYDNFSINTSFNYVNRSLNVPNTGQNDASGGGVFQSLLQIPVDIPIKDFAAYQNKFFNVDNYFTPYAENPYYGLHENGNKQTMDRFFGNIDMNYKFNKFWSAQYRLGGDFTNARTFGWKQVNAAQPGSWNGPNPTNPEGATKTPDVGLVSQGSDYSGLINMDLILKFNKDLNKDFNLEALGGANYYQASTRSEYTQITNLVIPSFFNLSNSSLPPTTTDYTSRLRRMGLYAQATLAYKNQLFLTGNIRNDWSSTLPTNNNSFFYSGANLSWIASKTLDLSNTAISFLKFRAAYGQTGSDAGVYQVYPTLSSANIGLGFGSLTGPFNGASAFQIANSLSNPHLQPVMTNEFEAGVEIRLFKDRIGLDATYYDKVTKGQIITVPIAPSSGYTSLVENLGKVGNHGIELTLNAKPVVSRNFNWSFVYTFTKNWNKVLDLTGGTPNPLISSAYDAELRAVVGKSAASIYAPIPQLSPDGKIVVNPTTGEPLANQTKDADGQTKGYYGSGLYNYTMGMVNTFSYKDFTLNFSLDFRSGGVMYSQTADMVLFVGNGIATTYNDRKPFIVPNSVVGTTDASGHTTYSPNTTVITADNYYGYYYPTTNPGTAYYQRIFDRSFLKLRDVNLSYNLPRAWASTVKASNVSIGLYGRNFLLWTPKANVYVDPEGSNLGNDLSSQLGEFASAPLAKYFGVILKASF